MKSITDAPSGFEGEGFPVRRAFAGISAVRSRSLHPHGPDGRGRVRAGRAQGHALASPSRLRDRDLHDRRDVPAPGLDRWWRTDHQRVHAVDDSGIGHSAHRAPTRAADRHRWPVPRDPAVGEPPRGREVGRPPLPEPRSARRRAPDLTRRRSTRAHHRRRRGRPPRARLDAHAHLPRPCHGAAGRRTGAAMAEPVQCPALCVVRGRRSGARGTPDPFGAARRARIRRRHLLAGRRTRRNPGTRRWMFSFSEVSRSANLLPRTDRSS